MFGFLKRQKQNDDIKIIGRDVPNVYQRGEVVIKPSKTMTYEKCSDCKECLRCGVEGVRSWLTCSITGESIFLDKCVKDQS